ncbi:hypothetical protein D4S03_04090 [bacterium]|nr:MAG: hypothetical protein D4S03_04090 [bacterium]
MLRLFQSYSGNRDVKRSLNLQNNKVSDSVKIIPDDPEKSDENSKVSDSVFPLPTWMLSNDFNEWPKDEWHIKELEDFFASEELPEAIKLNAWTDITDLHLFIQSHLSTVKAQNGNKTYLPYYQRLLQLRELLKVGSL